ncbi:MAG: type II toxin-antitoxin system PemK/MazF family toxin [Fimbriimonadales bacterium]
MKTPELGEVWLIPDTSSGEQKNRPAVVVNTTDYFRCRGDVVVLPISSKVDRARCQTDCVLHDWREAGLRKPSYVKCNPATFKQIELIEYIGRLSEADLAAVQAHLRRVFGF